MSERCIYRLPSGKFCKLWATRDSRLCHRHQPVEPAAPQPEPEPREHLERLDSYDDLYDTVRETLHDICVGKVPVGRAYAIGYFIDLWMRVFEGRLKDKSSRSVFRTRHRDELEERGMLMWNWVAEQVMKILLKHGKPPGVPDEEVDLLDLKVGTPPSDSQDPTPEAGK